MNYLETYEIWKKKQLEDPDLIAEMIEIEGNEQEIKERFIRMLECLLGQPACAACLARVPIG